MRNTLRIALLASSFFTLQASAENIGLIGFHGGWGFPKSTPGVSGGLDYGFQAEWAMSTIVNAGVFWSYQFLNNDAGTSSYEMPFGALINLNIMEGPGLYLGINVGAARVGSGEGSAAESTTHFSGGGQIGFDYPLTNTIAGGLECRFISIATELESTYVINTNGHLKYYF